MIGRLDMNAKKIISIADTTVGDGDAINYRVFRQKELATRLLINDLLPLNGTKSMTSNLVVFLKLLSLIFLKNKVYELFSGFSEVKMSLKIDDSTSFTGPFQVVRKLKIINMVDRFSDVQLGNHTCRFVTITRYVNDVKMRGKCRSI